MSNEEKQSISIDWRRIALTIASGGIWAVEPPRTPTTPTEWKNTPTVESRPGLCVGFEQLEQSIQSISSWGERNQKNIRFVSGLAATRDGANGMEILLVQGKSSENGEEKDWQFPGGKFDPSKDRNQFETLRRELRDELGVEVPETVSYVDSYVQAFKPDASSVWGIHNFRMHNCTWTDEQLQAHITATQGTKQDVAQHEWTSNPFFNKDGSERKLFPQVRRALIKLGYTPPHPLPEDAYDGNPDNNPGI